MDHILTLTYSRSGEQISTAVTVTADGEVNADVALAASATDYEVGVALDVSALKSLVVSCDLDVTIETNSSSAPDDTLTVKLNKPLLWYTDCGLANPLTVDVTKIYVTRTGVVTGTGTLKIRALQDVTPA